MVWTVAGAVVVARREQHRRLAKADPVQAVALARFANSRLRNSVAQVRQSRSRSEPRQAKPQPGQPVPSATPRRLDRSLLRLAVVVAVVVE
jgi:hypothetical protein